MSVNCSYSKRSLTRRSLNKLKTRRATTKFGVGDILTKLSTEFKKPENYFLFTLGVLSEFIPAINVIYASVKSVASEFAPCFAEFNQVSQDKDVVVSQFSELENKFKTPQERKTYCETAQHDIVAYHIKARMENNRNTPNFVRDTLSFFAGGSIVSDLAVGKIESIASSKETFCKETVELNAPGIQQIIKERYKTLAEFEKQCLYFHKSNCDTFNPETVGLTDFAKKAYKFWGHLKTAGKCIGNMLNDPFKLTPGGATVPHSNSLLSSDISINLPPILPALQLAKTKLVQYFTSDDFVATAMGSVLGLVANVMTFGIWGGLKGAYYLIKLGFQIKEFWDTYTVDTAYKIGAIVGKALLIVKSILLGRRKLLKKK